MASSYAKNPFENPIQQVYVAIKTGLQPNQGIRSSRLQPIRLGQVSPNPTNQQLATLIEKVQDTN